MPWVCSTEESAQDADYPLNIRNYMKSTNVVVKSVTQLRQKTDQGSTIEVIFESNLQYKTAGNLAIYAENNQDDVETFAKVLSLDLRHNFSLIKNPLFEGKKAQMPIPSGTHTIRQALTKFIDLTGPLSKKLVKELAQKCRSQQDREE